MTSRFPPFAFVELVSPYNKKNITRWLEDMNFMFSWQEQYLTRSLCSLVRYCSCHSNIKFISSSHRVISSLYKNNSERSDFIMLSRAKRARGLSQLRNSRLHKSLNICLVSASDVMDHFAFPGNIDFAADDQGAF